jgi:hypothetical protein
MSIKYNVIVLTEEMVINPSYHKISVLVWKSRSCFTTSEVWGASFGEEYVDMRNRTYI